MSLKQLPQFPTICWFNNSFLRAILHQQTNRIWQDFALHSTARREGFSYKHHPNAISAIYTEEGFSFLYSFFA